MALHVLTGDGAPAIAPQFVGQHYIDTTNIKHYLANGTAAAADWQEVGAGGAGTFDHGDKTGSDTVAVNPDNGQFQKINQTSTGMTVNIVAPANGFGVLDLLMTTNAASYNFSLNFPAGSTLYTNAQLLSGSPITYSTDPWARLLVVTWDGVVWVGETQNMQFAA